MPQYDSVQDIVHFYANQAVVLAGRIRRAAGAILGFSATQRPALDYADHGCDPDPVNPTTDHSREYVPILAYTSRSRSGTNLGIRPTLSDMGQTVAENFGGSIPHGTSFLTAINSLPAN
jgi:hypothetical protein